jgi:hypothetical protein
VPPGSQPQRVLLNTNTPQLEQFEVAHMGGLMTYPVVQTSSDYPYDPNEYQCNSQSHLPLLSLPSANKRQGRHRGKRANGQTPVVKQVIAGVQSRYVQHSLTNEQSYPLVNVSAPSIANVHNASLKRDKPSTSRSAHVEMVEENVNRCALVQSPVKNVPKKRQSVWMNKWVDHERQGEVPYTDRPPPLIQHGYSNGCFQQPPSYHFDSIEDEY